MKKVLTSFAVATLFAIAAVAAAPQDTPVPDQQAPAQGMRHHSGDPNRQVQRLARKLNLTAEQQNQLLPIFADRKTQFDSIRNDQSLSKTDRHAKLQALREDSQAKVKSVLTDEQKQAFDQMQQQMRNRAHRKSAQNSNS